MAVPRELQTGDHATVHLVGAVGEPERAGHRPGGGERKVI
jgi:hypothetical protein